MGERAAMRRLLFPFIWVATAASAASLSPRALEEVAIAPPVDARLPRGLAFVDQSGRAFALAPFARPTVLLFADFTCRHICGPGITLTAGALHDSGLRTPRDYRLIAIGMDQDGPKAARALIADRLRGLDGEARGIRLLTGSPATVAAAEAALGYRAVYDEASDQFAHDAASFVFTPDGRLSRVLPETAASPALIRGAVEAAARGEATTPADGNALSRIVAVCYGFAAAHGVHGAAIVAILRALGGATLGAIALSLWRLSRRRSARA